MTQNHPIDRAVRSLNTSFDGLGSILGVTKGAVSQWKMPGRKVPVGHCVTIEQATKGAVTRRDLRPNDWHLFWPELTQQEQFTMPESG